MTDVYDDDPIKKELASILKEVQNSTKVDEEDPSKKGLIINLQKLRAKLLDVAALSYLNKPSNSKLLDSINSLIGGVESSVRNDRKEEARKKDKEENRATFNQLLEAIKQVETKEIVLPEWSSTGWLLNPDLDISVIAGDVGKIKDSELIQGQFQTDLDGNEIK